ncbi:DUF3348 domain-containing protein [Trinickia violacea]|uniref:DUF3348 domain-containing protein n=1 Tax=Trinickia violacea TaxID=2571746 RepID=A0A4P8IQ76_9BURK|nr:DUF3348 domain-containing protein [Trinickia violacea]QCP49775.1 DUF3348 domain-containing protein [Trinickia violacea]
MVQAPQRTALGGPALVRLLARLADADVPESSQPLSDRLSQWLGWTDAIALSTALNGNPPPAASGARGAAMDDDLAKRCAHVRSALTKAIVGDSASASARRDGRAPSRGQEAPPDARPDFAVFRQRYLSLQQTMDTEIGTLRTRLRTMLASRPHGVARLAMVDAVMERALSAREQSLFAAVPAWLAGHFQRLRQAEDERLAEAADANADADADAEEVPATVTPGAWLDVFRKDMQSVLLAELEVRFKPVEGLLAALRTR